jgi:Ribonuclease E/G family
MAGAFVALPEGATDGFLLDSAGGRDAQEGEWLAVRVTRAPQGGKGARLARTDDPADGPLRRLSRGPGAIERLAALHPEATIEVDRPGLAATLSPVLRERLRKGEVRDDVVREVFEALELTEVTLSGGARLTVTPTPALTAIDIDAGGASGERLPKGQAQRALNRRLLPEIARQIRLRNLGGAILVDPAGLSVKDRAALAAALAEALADDPLKPRLLGFSALGLAEILRPRLHAPLHEVLTGDHAESLTALAALCRAWETAPAGGQHAIIASPAIAARIEADRVAVTEFRERIGQLPRVIADPAQRPLPVSIGWRLVTAAEGC